MTKLLFLSSFSDSSQIYKIPLKKYSLLSPIFSTHKPTKEVSLSTTHTHLTILSCFSQRAFPKNDTYTRRRQNSSTQKGNKDTCTHTPTHRSHTNHIIHVQDTRLNSQSINVTLQGALIPFRLLTCPTVQRYTHTHAHTLLLSAHTHICTHKYGYRDTQED